MVDKRLHARVPIDATLVCERAGGESFAVHAKDISVGGMYLDSSEQPAFGTQVTMVGLLPGAKKELRLPAVVRWAKPGGFGVQFGLLGAMETHVISELMKGY
ncbi:MAG TPA: PilZ domain-containing protein [Polyangiaceae bacterium]|nr:PilZ domain-containing protein [Polyangiaceae bacterium]